MQYYPLLDPTIQRGVEAAKFDLLFANCRAEVHHPGSALAPVDAMQA